jgi:peptidoglycan/LPS O-acetylase OafA/YrhL
LLRITAALAVVFYHYTFSGYAGHLTSIAFPTLSAVTRYGYLGVDMFFTISGFVVLLSAWGRRPHEFVISRIVRLYPAYWVAVTITAVVAITLSHGLFKVTPAQYVANLTMINSLPHIANVDVVYWTLWAEIRFYLLVFVLAWIGITRARVVTVLWLWLAAAAVIEAHVLPAGLAGLAGTIDVLVQSQWSHYFIAGMALCLIYRTGFSWPLGAVLVIAYGNAVYQAIKFAHLVSDRYHQVLHPQVIAAVITVIFILATLIALRVTRRFGRPWFALAGALTYPLYLVHAYNGFVLFNLFGGAVNRWVLLVATVTGMCGAAYAIHRLVEVRLAPRLKRALVRVAAAAGLARPGSRALAQLLVPGGRVTHTGRQGALVGQVGQLRPDRPLGERPEPAVHVHVHPGHYLRRGAVPGGERRRNLGQPLPAVGDVKVERVRRVGDQRPVARQ